MKFSLKIRIFILIVFTVLASFFISAIILRGNEYFSENIIAGISLFLILILAAGTTLYRFLRDVVIKAARIISGPDNNEEIDSESAFDTLRTSTAVVQNELESYSKQLSFISNLLSRMGQGVILVNEEWILEARSKFKKAAASISIVYLKERSKLGKTSSLAQAQS